MQFDPAKTNSNEIASAITDSGYVATAEINSGTDGPAEEERLHRQRDHARAWFRRAVAGLILWFPVEAIHWIRHLTHGHIMHGVDWMIWLSLATSTIAIVYIGWAFYLSAFRAALLRHEQHGHADRDGDDSGLRLQPGCADRPSVGAAGRWRICISWKPQGCWH